MTLSAVAGAWAVATALAAGILTRLAVNGPRIPSLRANIDACADASVQRRYTWASCRTILTPVTVGIGASA